MQSMTKKILFLTLIFSKTVSADDVATSVLYNQKYYEDTLQNIANDFCSNINKQTQNKCLTQFRKNMECVKKCAIFN